MFVRDKLVYYETNLLLFHRYVGFLVVFKTCLRRAIVDELGILTNLIGG